LPLELGDHRQDAINPGKPNEVHQQHERFYVEFGNEQTPVANTVIRGLATRVQAMRQFPELRNWQPTEIGYQRYRSVSDYIGPHRDRTTDKLLSVTFTIAGAAIVRTFESIKGEGDYSQLRPIDQHEASAGGMMLLRAPGFGPAGQTVHEVLPPHTAPRSILILRMRLNVLAQPSRQK